MTFSYKCRIFLGIELISFNNTNSTSRCHEITLINHNNKKSDLKNQQITRIKESDLDQINLVKKVMTFNNPDLNFDFNSTKIYNNFYVLFSTFC